MTPLLLLLTATIAADSLPPGDHNRTLTVDGRERIYLVHVPTKYDDDVPTPVVLVLHGTADNQQTS